MLDARYYRGDRGLRGIDHLVGDLLDLLLVVLVLNLLFVTNGDFLMQVHLQLQEVLRGLLLHHYRLKIKN
jgi:hypothetical protein